MTSPTQGTRAERIRAPMTRSRSLSPTRLMLDVCSLHSETRATRYYPEPSEEHAPIPSHGNVLRSRSLNTTELEEKRRHRVRLQYQDEGLRSRFCENARAMIDLAQHETNGSAKSIFMAKKALRYRGVLGRMEKVDPQDPRFDVSQFLGVEWCKTLQEPMDSSSPETNGDSCFAY